MNLRVRAIEASKQQKIKNDQNNATRTLAILNEKYGTIGEIDGECVMVAAGTDDELKFKINPRYGGRGDVKVWHNDAWHEVYTLEGLGDVLLRISPETPSQTSAERMVEALEELMYEIAEEVRSGG